MAKNKFRITESDFLLANRKASREEEIAKFGKQVIFRTSTQKSKKVYDRKRLKKADIKNIDDLPYLYLLKGIVHSFAYALDVLRIFRRQINTASLHNQRILSNFTP